jgi:hypothetical protein
MTVIASLLFVYVTWKISGFLSSRPKRHRPPRAIRPTRAPVRETPAQRYSKNLATINRLPLTEEERILLKEEARKQYIRESCDNRMYEESFDLDS